MSGIEMTNEGNINQDAPKAEASLRSEVSELDKARELIEEFECYFILPKVLADKLDIQLTLSKAKAFLSPTEGDGMKLQITETDGGNWIDYHYGLKKDLEKKDYLTHMKCQMVHVVPKSVKFTDGEIWDYDRVRMDYVRRHGPTEQTEGEV